MLHTPFTLRGVTFRNRIVISPMCQYSATDGVADDYHLVHLGRFALGGAGCVMVEATAVQEEGRITHGDIGLWRDDQAAPLARIAGFLKREGAVPAIQIGHAGRKAASQRPWDGSAPLTEADAARGEAPWPIAGASALPLSNLAQTPRAMTTADIESVIAAFLAAGGRAAAAGYELLEIHGAHGYLLHSFTSPLSNHRTDDYGGSRENRFRLPVEIARALRAQWPAHLPLAYRVSAVDGAEGGHTIEDNIALAQALKAVGVDVIDCSSGGIAGAVTAARIKRSYGFQVPFAAAIRREAGLPTMAVGLIVDPHQAEAILQAEDADFIAIAREALVDPNWPLRAQQALAPDPEFKDWPKQSASWLAIRQPQLEALGSYKP